MASKQYYRVCFCFRRIFKLRVPEPPEDVKVLFDQHSQNGTMSVDDLRSFMVNFQGEVNATAEDVQAIFNSLKHLNIFQRRGLHLQAFFRYLLGDLNTAHSTSRGVHHDMNAPLAHYFLFTGHNSYLTGNQLSSSSSVDPIVRALRRGVKVIELDLWPNSNKTDVEVRHGGTLTAPVDFLKCLHAIKDHAFVVSEYPVIITFEDHLTPNLQAKVAKMVNKTFGEMLFRPESDHLEEFPSPECLKHRVLISTKPPQRDKEGETSRKSKRPAKRERWNEVKMVSKSDDDTYDEDEHDEEDIPEEDEDQEAPEYEKLIAIHAGKRKGSSGSWLYADTANVRRVSLSEQTLEQATRTYGVEIVRFTQRNLLRVYPKGLRLDSSNYNPFIAWIHGAQMVAFNMQGYGKHLWVMQGLFKANGGCGYVKKPEFLLKPGNDVFDPQLKLPVKALLKVKVFLGEGWHLDFHHTHFDTYSPPDFFVKVAIAGVRADKAKRTTKVIEDNWLPLWNEEFIFPLTVPELAVLRIEVLEYDTTKENDFGGQTCLPVSELRTGIRSVPLHDRRGDRYKYTRLLMQFEIFLL